jgi:hypothetical protein
MAEMPSKIIWIQSSVVPNTALFSRVTQSGADETNRIHVINNPGAFPGGDRHSAVGRTGALERAPSGGNR